MEDNHISWVKIKESEMSLEIDLASATLQDLGIPNIVMDKKDSAYVVLGRMELYVPREFVIKAKKALTVEEDMKTN